MTILLLIIAPPPKKLNTYCNGTAETLFSLPYRETPQISRLFWQREEVGREEKG